MLTMMSGLLFTSFIHLTFELTINLTLTDND